MSITKDAKVFSRSFTHLLKRAVQYSSHLYMDEVGKSGLTHRQFTVLSAADTFEGKSQTELVKITGIDRSTLADLVARGELEVPIAGVFALDDVREAYRQLELRHTRGKLVLRP